MPTTADKSTKPSTTANRVLSARISKPVTKGRQTYRALVPLAGVTEQDTTPWQSAWLQVGAGAYLSLTLTLANFAGTLDVAIETVNDPAKDTPRPLGSFCQINTNGTTQLSGTCDHYVRISATPGTGVAQAASWRIDGKAFPPSS